MNETTSRKGLTHDRILDVASRAIRRAGYDGVGVANIMKEAGLTHGGFYAHFPSRKAMLIEATQRAGRDTGEFLQRRVNEGQAKGMSAFAAFIHSYLSESHLSSPEQGCVVAALASEMPRQDAAVARVARERVQSLINAVRQTLPKGVDPEQAQVIVATMVGAMQLARTLQGPDARACLAQASAFLIEQFDVPNRPRT